MPTILAVYSMTRYSSEILDRAIAKAREMKDPRITILYITEKKDLEKLKEQAGNQGFLGTSPVDRMMNVILREHDKLKIERLAEIRRRLEEEGIAYEVIERKGTYSDRVIREVEKVKYDSVFLPKPSKSFLERLFLGSEVKRVAEYSRSKQSEVNIVE